VTVITGKAEGSRERRAEEASVKIEDPAYAVPEEEA
jgi:hypothetical protein